MTTTSYTLKIDRDLWDQWKTTLTHGLTINDHLVELIREKVENGRDINPISTYKSGGHKRTDEGPDFKDIVAQFANRLTEIEKALVPKKIDEEHLHLKTRDELRKLARAHSISGVVNMTKSDLIKRIKEHRTHME